jgi:hypothetical protein
MDKYNLTKKSSSELRKIYFKAQGTEKAKIILEILNDRTKPTRL